MANPILVQTVLVRCSSLCAFTLSSSNSRMVTLSAICSHFFYTTYAYWLCLFR